MNKIITFVAAMLFCGASHASYLYWQVDAADAEGFDFNYARVVADNGTTTQVLDFTDDYGVTKAGYSLVAVGNEAAINLDQLGSPDAYSFYIELVNYNSATESFDVVGTSKPNPASYATLVKSNFIDVGKMGLPITPAAVWHGTPYSVPEPTGAMLVMFGLGLLALKRKRV